MKKLNSLLQILLLTSILISACTQPSASQSQSTITPEPSLPTSTPTSVMKVIGTVPSSLATTDVLVVTPTFSISSPATVTPTVPVVISTLTIDQTKDFLLTALQDNRQCKLPCILGVIPRRTDADTLEKLLGKFGNIDSPELYLEKIRFRDFGGIISIMNKDRGSAINLLFASHLDNSGSVEQVTLGWEPYGNSMTVGEWDYLVSNQTFKQYTLPEVLSTYGKPSQVFVWSYHTEHTDLSQPWYPFSLVLIYEHQGFLIAYTAKREKTDTNYIGCPLQTYFKLTSWDVESGLTWKDAVHKLSGWGGVTDSNVSELMTISDASMMGIDEFFQKYKDPKSTDCISTPILLWTNK